MTVNPDAIAAAIENAPAWAVLALSTRSERLRRDARRELGEHIYCALYQPVDVDTAQMALPL